jgi:hypothetical protein
MAICLGVISYSGFLSIGVYFVVSKSWCGVSRLLVGFSRVPVSLCIASFRGKHFLEPEVSLPHSQELSTCPYPEPDQSSQYPLHSLPPKSILILSTQLRLGLPSGLLPPGFPTNNLYAFLFSPIRVTCPRPSHPP